MFLLLLLSVSAAVDTLQEVHQNLTHSSYYHYNFEDYTFTERYDAQYLKGKHCANLYLMIDHNTEETGVDIFKQCIEDAYPAAFQEYELTSLRYIFDIMFDDFDKEYKNSYLYEEKKDSLYQTFVDIQHDFGSFKVDIVSSARRFVHPVYDLTMASTPLQGRQALNQSIDIIADLQATVQTIADLYDTIIQTKSNSMDTYKANYLAAQASLTANKKFYESNVSTVLKRLTIHPSTLITCQPGYYCISNPTACPAGTFQPKANMTSSLACILTPVYTYSNLSAANWSNCSVANFMGATTCP